MLKHYSLKKKCNEKILPTFQKILKNWKSCEKLEFSRIFERTLIIQR